MADYMNDRLFVCDEEGGVITEMRRVSFEWWHEPSISNTGTIHHIVIVDGEDSRTRTFSWREEWGRKCVTMGQEMWFRLPQDAEERADGN